MTESADKLDLEKNFNKVKMRLNDALIVANRDPASAELLAVSKKHSPDAILTVAGFGQSRFGENYPSELFNKAEILKKANISWVFVGTLQSNKISRLVKICDEIQTVSSIKHLNYIDRYARENLKSDFPVFLQVNVSDEKQKAGFSTDALDEAIKHAKSLKSISLKGLMAIPARVDSILAQKGELPTSYKKLRMLCESYNLKQLSLGMSADLETAIAAGSTCIRVGTDIFGKREP